MIGEVGWWGGGEVGCGVWGVGGGVGEERLPKDCLSGQSLGSLGVG